MMQELCIVVYQGHVQRSFGIATFADLIEA
jgi:hypothetical protein